MCFVLCGCIFGGVFRDVSYNGKLIYHAPYRSDLKFPMRIMCAGKSDAEMLRSYYSQMIPGASSERLFERTMDYCDLANGWTVDRGAAEFFGLLR